MQETKNEQEVKQEQAQTIEQEKPVETQEQINWKKFREQREIERKEKVEIEKRLKQKEEEAIALKAAMEAALNKPSKNNNRYDDEEEEETEDQRIQKKVEAALAVREKALQEQRNRDELANMPQKLNKTYSDFNDVCTSENLDYLEYHYPEIASVFQNAPDSFDKWASIYKTVKKLLPNADSRKDSKKAENNFNKPQSMAVAGATQTTDSAPRMLDDKKREDNWARMQRVMKGG